MSHYAEAGFNECVAQAWCYRGWNEDHGSLEEAEAAARRHQELASEDHRIEETAKVYLVLRDGRWQVDRPTIDGHPLDSAYGGPLVGDCECGDDEACEAARTAAANIPLPNARELYELLGEALAGEQ